MPVTVVVRSASGGESPSLTFDGSRIVIGRSDGCDVRLPDPSVSQRHASIRSQGSEYAVVDEGSTNGTWVGGVKLSPQTPRLVKSGDLLRVGRVWLELAIGQNAPTHDIGLATRDLALALVRRAMDAAGDDTCTVVRVVEGPDIGAVLRVADEGRVYVIGRAERCDLPLADEDASREHAAVVRRGGRVFLRDLGSRNGILLGDARLAENAEIAWRTPGMVRVGVSVLALDEPIARALAELEAAADEALPEVEPANVEAPPSAAPPPPSLPAGQAMPPSVAPMVEPPRLPSPSARPKRGGWSAFDIVVVSIAVAVIGVSLVGLVWVLR